MKLVNRHSGKILQRYHSQRQQFLGADPLFWQPRHPRSTEPVPKENIFNDRKRVGLPKQQLDLRTSYCGLPCTETR